MTPISPHPRDVFDYLGGRAEAAFAGAMARGRLHHAWLLTGPAGVGKATFAYRAARRLLGAAPFGDGLAAHAEDPVSRLVSARSHPDLLVLQRELEDGKPRKGIPVDEMRLLPEFFAKSPAQAPYRVAIIDAADDLADAAANALLKTLEEPSERGVLFLVAHAPGRLLPTIRSRCRRLAFTPPPEEAAASWVADRARITTAEARRLLDLAQGAPGAAWRLAAAGALEIEAMVAGLVDRLPRADPSAVLALADTLRGAEGAGRFEIIFKAMQRQLQRRATGSAMSADDRRLTSARREADAWSWLVRTAPMATALNLDRGETLHAAVAHLRRSA
ncbi:MAG: DNA polymerase III subunit delta' [Caulobacteraceae bacterium]|nr:DNA polymerase III subunit delta' [Caulobacteraceae bacterium]